MSQDFINQINRVLELYVSLEGQLDKLKEMNINLFNAKDQEELNVILDAYINMSMSSQETMIDLRGLVKTYEF